MEIFLERWKLFQNVQKCGNIHPQSRYFKISLIRFTVKDHLDVIHSKCNQARGVHVYPKMALSKPLMNVLLEYFKLADCSIRTSQSFHLVIPYAN